MGTFQRITLTITQSWLRLTLLPIRKRRVTSLCLLTILTSTQTHLRLRMQKKNMTPTLVILAVAPRERAGMMPPDLKRRPRRLLKLRRKPKKAERKKLQLLEKRKRVEKGERKK